VLQLLWTIFSYLGSPDWRSARISRSVYFLLDSLRWTRRCRLYLALCNIHRIVPPYFSGYRCNFKWIQPGRKKLKQSKELQLTEGGRFRTSSWQRFCLESGVAARSRRSHSSGSQRPMGGAGDVNDAVVISFLLVFPCSRFISICGLSTPSIDWLFPLASTLLPLKQWRFTKMTFQFPCKLSWERISWEFWESPMEIPR